MSEIPLSQVLFLLILAVGNWFRGRVVLAVREDAVRDIPAYATGARSCFVIVQCTRLSQ